MNELVSLVMPVWRTRADWLRTSVTSALDEQACDIELIVIDDGSEDGGVAAALADINDPRLRVISVEHGGPYAARNAGIRLARGSYVRFVDSDDFVEPGSTGRLLAVARSGACMAYGATLMCDDALVPQRTVTCDLEGDVSEHCVLDFFEVYVVSILFPRAVVDAVPWEEQAFRVSGDFDFVLRALERAPVLRLDEIVTRYRRHGLSVSKSADVAAGARARHLVLDRYFERHPDQRGTSLERRAYLRLHLDRARAHLVRGQLRPAGHHLMAATRRDARAALVGGGRLLWGEVRRRVRGIAPAANGGATRARGAVPEPLAERLRLLLAWLLEARVRKSAAVRGVALVFHTVGPVAGDRLRELDPPVQADRLDAAVRYLTTHYRPVRAAELPAMARDRRPGQPVPVAVTFDDDLASHREHAVPVFERNATVATAFLCGVSSPFWWQLLQCAVDELSIAADGLPHVESELVAAALERRPRAIARLAKAVEDLDPGRRDDVLAALEQVVDAVPRPLGREGSAALAAAGWEIGFHTARHDALPALDDKSLREALVGGRDLLPGAPVLTIAYPHGKATAREAAAARAAGYVAAYTGCAEVLTEQTDTHLIGRLQPDTTTVGRFALRIARALAAG